MEAKELREGNIIYQGAEYGNCSVTQYDIYQYSLLNRNARIADFYYEWQPIPLTEEILSKCGFKRELYTLNWKKDNCRIIPQKAVLGGWDIFIYYSNEDNVHLLRIEYVHQLQNLYFALTGEELQITL